MNVASESEANVARYKKYIYIYSLSVHIYSFRTKFSANFFFINKNPAIFFFLSLAYYSVLANRFLKRCT